MFYPCFLNVFFIKVNVFYVFFLFAAGRRIQAGDATDQWRINENQLIFDEVKAYKNYAKFLVYPDVIPAGCDSYFRQ